MFVDLKIEILSVFLSSSRESYTLNTKGPRVPAVSSSSGYVVNPTDHTDGMILLLCSCLLC